MYEEMPGTSQGSSSRSARWRYVGGETRLVGLTRISSFSHFLQQLSKATSAVWDEVGAGWGQIISTIFKIMAEGGGFHVCLFAYRWWVH